MCLCQRQKIWSRIAVVVERMTPPGSAESPAIRPWPMLCSPP